MRIQDPVLVVDVSNWVNHINAREFEDGGCASVIVGLYPLVENGKTVLNPKSRAQCVEVATKSNMLLQGYFWDDIILDPVKQADWLADTLVMEGLPVKFVWADQEQWWSNWAAWYQLRRGVITSDEVPKALPANISSHNAAFNKRFHERFPAHGVYTNNGFVASWSPQMNSWLSAYASWVPYYRRQPAIATRMTWEQLKANWLPDYDIALAPGQQTAMVKGHQFTGDACILPGSYDAYNRSLALDVSVFERTFIDGLRGNAPVSEPAPELPKPGPVLGHPDICPTCGQSWPQAQAVELYPTYRVISGKNPYVHTGPNGTSTAAGSPGYILAGMLVSVDTLSGDYAHIRPTAGFPNGGWVFAPYLEKA